MAADTIKLLRNARGMTQADLAKKLNITRSSVNAWEMGISVVKYSLKFFSVFFIWLFSGFCQVVLSMAVGYFFPEKVSRSVRSSIDISGLDDTEIKIIYELIQHFSAMKKTK
mgnify:CR=1 FL=1